MQVDDDEFDYDPVVIAVEPVKEKIIKVENATNHEN